jgi:hypothetical protein
MDELIEEAEMRVRVVEKLKGKVSDEEFRRQYGMAVLWLRLFNLLKKRYERFKTGEGVEALHLGFLNEDADHDGKLEEILYGSTCELFSRGIPFSMNRYYILVLEEDYEEVVRVLRPYQVLPNSGNIGKVLQYVRRKWGRFQKT